MNDDRLTYQDFLDAVAVLETYRPSSPSIIIWPPPDSFPLFPDIVWEGE